MKCTIIGIMVLMVCCDLFGQESSNIVHPETGKPCPDFTLTDVQNYPKKQVSLKDFKGKWLILDFWNKGCAPCISYFPHYNELQAELGSHVQFLLVGYIGMVNGKSYDKDTRNLFSYLKKKLSLTLPVAYDSSVCHSWDILPGPLAIIIDPEGIVRGVVGSVKRDDLDNLISGRAQYLFKFAEIDYWKHESFPEYTEVFPFLTAGRNINGVSDTNFLYRSLLMKWSPDIVDPHHSDEAIMQVRADDNNNRHFNRFQLFGRGALSLYKAAYWGTANFPLPKDTGYYRKAIFEMKDSSLFTIPNYSENTFIYSLTVPSQRASKADMMRVMQNDLKNYFKYDAKVETRKLPYWRLVVADPQKVAALRSTDKHQAEIKKMLTNENMNTMNYWGIHISTTALLSMISQQTFYETASPMIDETGIDFTIDVFFDCIKQNLGDVRRVLRENGFDLVQGIKDLEVLVIRDPGESAHDQVKN